nr:M23 family metallopeptidase [Paenactinomyces guangxiensis]
MNKYGTSGNGDYGENVVASAPGTVKSVVNLGDRSYGLYIIIDHGGGWETLYAHLSSANVSQGQSVQAGDGIGKVGNSGTTYAHLHYEQRYQGDDRPVTLQGYTFSYPSDSRTMTSQNCGGSNEITGTVHTDNGLPVNVRSGPGTSYSIVGKKYDGDVVTIECQIRGETVTGKYGTSDLWDRIGPGQYISDTYVYTGSDGQVAPTCPSP